MAEELNIQLHNKGGATRYRSRTHTIAYFLTALVLSALLVRIFLVDSFTVTGNSMAPTIVDGDYVFVNKFAYRGNATPERGDIVVGNFRTMDMHKVIKRVVGLPHEWIRLDKGSVLIASDREAEYQSIDAQFEEIFSNGTEAESTDSYRLDPHEYYLVGDNRPVSVDSRTLGPIDIYDINGRVFASFRIRTFSLFWF